MKHTLFFISVLCSANILSAAKDSSKLESFQIGIDVGRTPVELSMLHYNYDQWQINSLRDYKYTRHSNAIGIYLQKRIRNIFAELKFTYCDFGFKETGGFSVIYNAEPIIGNNSHELKQTIMGIHPGIKLKHQMKKFTFSGGFELPFLMYSKGELSEISINKRYYPNGGVLHYESEWENRYYSPSGLIYGLGMNAELSYSPLKNLRIGIAMNSYYLVHRNNKETFMDYKFSNASYNSDGSLYSRGSDKTRYTIGNDAKLNAFTGFLPSIRIAYAL